MMIITAKVPLGYEPVGIRPPLHGEKWCRLYPLDYKGTIIINTYDKNSSSGEKYSGVGNQCVMIVREAFKWPDWVRPGTWAYTGVDGFWMLSCKEPIMIGHNLWQSPQGIQYLGRVLEIQWPERNCCIMKPHTFT